MSDALVSTREGVLGHVSAEDAAPPEAQPDEVGSEPASRLMRLSETERSAVLLGEAVEGLRIKRADVRVSVAVVAETGARLLRIERPSLARFRAALNLVEDHADLREDRLAEIHLQISDQLSFFGSVTPLQPAGYRDTLRLLSALLDHVTLVCQRIKLHLGAPRPEVLSPRIQPVIQTPSHGAFPSGHAAQAFAVAEVLALLRHPADAERLAAGEAPSEAGRQLYRMASRIAVNRTVAGVHYPADSAAGAVIGRTLARLAWARAGGAAEVRDVTFRGDAYVEGDADVNEDEAARDFHLGEFARLVGGDDPAAVPGEVVEVAEAPMLAVLAERARAEWAARW